MIDLAALIGLKVQPVSEDDASEALWLRQLDRFGDRHTPHHGHMMDEPEESHLVEVMYHEPKARRRVRFAAKCGGFSSQ